MLCVGVILTVMALLAVIECAEAGPLLGYPPWEILRLGALVAVHCALLASIVLLVTRRLLFAAVLTLVVAAGLLLISKTKYAYLHSRLVFHDFYFHATNRAEIAFLFDQQRQLTVAIVTASAIFVTILALVWRIDRSRVPRLIGLCVFGVTVLLSEVAVRQHQDKLKDIFWRGFFDEAHLSSFILSTRTFAATVGRRFTLPTTSETVQSAFVIPASHQDDPVVADPPHIIVILHESSVDPSIYFVGDRFKVPKSFFASGDGKIRRMRVHTWGGGTWITEYGLLLGLDMSYFEEYKNFLGFIGVGSFQNTFPQELARLGYKTIANYPSPLSFMNTDIFFRSIGFQDLYKPEDMQLFIRATARPRDRDYYAFLMDDLGKRKARGETAPMFYFVWTTATHNPYFFPMFPSERMDEISDGDETIEFARRQRIASDDLVWFEETLRNRFPHDKFLIAGFGDHHPYVTADYYKKRQSGLQGLQPFDPSELQNETYFRINGVNFAPAYAQLPGFADVGFLGEIILEAARLPASPSFLARRELRTRCSGEWAECADKRTVLRTNTILSMGVTSAFTPTQ